MYKYGITISLMSIALSTPVLASSPCEESYEDYLASLKDISKNYQKRNFNYISRNKDKFISLHSEIIKVCNGSEVSYINSDIEYGKSFIVPLTTNYQHILKKYGYKEKRKVLRVVDKPLLYLESIHSPDNTLKNIISKNEDLPLLEEDSINPLIKEEKRLIDLEIEVISEVANVYSNVEVEPLKKEYQDLFRDVEEDVIVIEVK